MALVSGPSCCTLRTHMSFCESSEPLRSRIYLALHDLFTGLSIMYLAEGNHRDGSNPTLGLLKEAPAPLTSLLVLNQPIPNDSRHQFGLEKHRGLEHQRSRLTSRTHWELQAFCFWCCATSRKQPMPLNLCSLWKPAGRESENALTVISPLMKSGTQRVSLTVR